MSKDSELLEKVTIFLVVLVGALLIFTQYQFYKLSQNTWTYLSVALILALVGLVAWTFMEKKPKEHHNVHETHHEHLHHEPKPFTSMEKLSIGLVVIVGVMILFNHVQISQVSALAGFNSGLAGLTFKSSSSKTSVKLTGDPTQDAMAIVIPRGTPFYGQSLGVSFDDPIRSLEIIAQLDPSYGRNKIQLAAEEKQRYISILTTPSMGCQYCCGADTAVTKDGRPTCGCKHSWAMRGLTAYLIKSYPDLSDDEIKREVARWKGLFFPKQMIQKYIQEAQTGQFTADIAALLLDVDEEKLKEMKAAVASGNAQDPSQPAADVNNLPNMVGGC